jgi:hypothetical protein
MGITTECTRRSRTTGLHDSLQLTPRLRAGQPWINERDPASVLHRVAVHVAQARQRDGQLQSQDPRRNLLDTLSRRLPFFTNWLQRGMVVVGHLRSRSGGEHRSRSRTAPIRSDGQTVDQDESHGSNPSQRYVARMALDADLTAFYDAEARAGLRSRTRFVSASRDGFCRTPPRDGRSRVDVGAGPGARHGAFRDQGFDVIGVDLAPANVGLMRRVSTVSPGRCTRPPSRTERSTHCGR